MIGGLLFIIIGAAVALLVLKQMAGDLHAPQPVPEPESAEVAQ